MLHLEIINKVIYKAKKKLTSIRLFLNRIFLTSTLAILLLFNQNKLTLTPLVMKPICSINLWRSEKVLTTLFWSL